MLNNFSGFIEAIKDKTFNLDLLYSEFNTISTIEKVNAQQIFNPIRFMHLMTGNNLLFEKGSIPYTINVIDQIRQYLEFNAVTYRILSPKSCYLWHIDIGKVCIHIPIISNPECFFVFENKTISMPPNGFSYVVNNSLPHTFLNGGQCDRLHLTFETL